MDGLFTRISTTSAYVIGKPVTFILALAFVAGWGACGPFFGYSQVWQLVINTSTTILTFLAIPLLQSSQNRDGGAIQAKLDELIRVTEEARDAFIGLERRSEEEIERMREGGGNG